MPQKAAKAPSPLRVACDDNYPPYAFRGANGELKGIVVDHWAAWSAAMGIRVELEGLPWAEAINAFESGRVDVLDTVFETEDRIRHGYRFTSAYADIRVPVFIHKSLSGIADARELRGLKVGVKDSDAAIQELVRRGVTELALYPSYEAIIDAAARLDIRVFCVDAPPALFFLYRRGIDRDFRVAFELGKGAFHRAVRSGDEELLALIEHGFASLPRGRLEAIDRTWLGTELARGIDLRIIALSGGGALALLGLLAFVAWTLRRQVRAATMRLREELAHLAESEAKTKAFIAALPDFFFTLDREGRYLEVHTAQPELLALPPERFLGRRMDELGMPEPLVQGFLDKAKEARESGRMAFYEYDLNIPILGTRHFEGRIVPLGADRVVLVARDITESRLQEARLKASLAEKEVLLKEVHHRVKNNLQVISSLIQLQSYALRDEHDRELVRETQARIRAMANVHELLYRSPDLASIEAAAYLHAMAEELALGYGFTGLSFSGDTASLSIDEAVPLGLIANELILNAIKYAYDAGDGSIEVTLTREEAELVLRVRDEGKGLPPQIDPLRCDSMGFTIVRNLSAQLGGRLSYRGPPGLCAEFRFTYMAARG